MNQGVGKIVTALKDSGRYDYLIFSVKSRITVVFDFTLIISDMKTL